MQKDKPIPAARIAAFGTKTEKMNTIAASRVPNLNTHRQLQRLLVDRQVVVFRHL